MPLALRSDAVNAIDFLDAVRCFLHYRQGRDLNGLTYEMQSEAASQGIGLHGGRAASPNDWMRVYFRHARAIDRLTVLFDEIPRSKSIWSRIRGFRKLPYSTAEFAVMDGRVSLSPLTSVEDPRVMFRLFDLVAAHNVKLTAETENAVGAALPRIQKWLTTVPDLWEPFRKILVMPHAAASLRAMHRLGLLDLLFPEFRYIDSLVIRDYYHRYTVDEHSLVTIENSGTWLTSAQATISIVGSATFSPTLEHGRNCLILHCCFTTSERVCRSRVMGRGASEVSERAPSSRPRLDSIGRETVNFLIGNHLRMALTLDAKRHSQP